MGYMDKPPSKMRGQSCFLKLSGASIKIWLGSENFNFFCVGATRRCRVVGPGPYPPPPEIMWEVFNVRCVCMCKSIIDVLGF